MAQTDDPFGEVTISQYQNTMNITGYVRLGGESGVVLDDETVVAVYQGQELRGKKKPFSSGDYTHLLKLTIYGNIDKQPLHFKVYTDGRVIEVDQGLTFKTNSRVGKLTEPYYINLPEPVITTPSTEGWATTCLPYDAAVPEGVTLWNVTGIADGQLLMEEVEAPQFLPANTPVLLEQTSSQPVEWLARVVDESTLAQQSSKFKPQSSKLKGTTEPTAVTANSVLTLGHSEEGNHEIGFWLYTGTEIPAYRAYIDDFPANSRGYALFGEPGTTTPVSHLAASPSDSSTFAHSQASSIDNCHDLSGRRVSSQTLKSANRKTSVIIADGKKFLVK